MPSLTLIPMKRAPKKPQITPRIIPDGRSIIEFSLANERSHSFSEPESDKLSDELEDKDSRLDKVKVVIEVAVNTL